jgi:6-pyruvoyltetrahydropterin/6-carboxytetrahydropterin synthase
MKVAVFRKEHFNAAHRLHNPNWSEEKIKGFSGNAIMGITMGTIMN